jgi:hypothetical protein
LNPGTIEDGILSAARLTRLRDSPLYTLKNDLHIAGLEHARIDPKDLESFILDHSGIHVGFSRVIDKDWFLS